MQQGSVHSGLFLALSAHFRPASAHSWPTLAHSFPGHASSSPSFCKGLRPQSRNSVFCLRSTIWRADGDGGRAGSREQGSERPLRMPISANSCSPSPVTFMFLFLIFLSSMSLRRIRPCRGSLTRLPRAVRRALASRVADRIVKEQLFPGTG